MLHLWLLTQEPTIRKIVATHAFQILEWFTVTYHHHVNPSYKAKSFKQNQCIVAWGNANNQVGGNVEPQKDHILFIISHTIYHLILIFPSIKPLIFTTFIINMGLYYHFPNHWFLSILSEFVVNYWEKMIFHLYFKVGWVWWCLQVYLKTLTSSKVAT